MTRGRCGSLFHIRMTFAFTTPRRFSRRTGETAMHADSSVLERMPEALAFSKSEAARMLGVSLRTVDRLIALKHLPVRRLGRCVLIPRNSLQSFLRVDHPTRGR